jgi:hypothetical protein
MAASRYRLRLAWVGIVYIAVVATVLYPALHEGFDARITLWNCLPPTLGLILISTALGKSSRRIVVSSVFALLTAAVATFFSAAWFFTPLDLDSHSATTWSIMSASGQKFFLKRRFHKSLHASGCVPMTTRT